MGTLANSSRQAAPADNELRTGTVVKLTNSTTGASDGIYVSFSPDASAAPARCTALEGYYPVVGDVVQVLRQGAQFLILGPAFPYGAQPVTLTMVSPWTMRSAGDSRFAPLKAVRLPWALWVAGDVVANGAGNGSAVCSIPDSLLVPWTSLGVTRYIGTPGTVGGTTLGSTVVWELHTDAKTINAFSNSGFASANQINAWFPYW